MTRDANAKAFAIAEYLYAFRQANGPQVEPPTITYERGWFALSQGSSVTTKRWGELIQMTERLRARAAGIEVREIPGRMGESIG